MTHREVDGPRSECWAVAALQPHAQAAEVPTLSEADYRTLRDDIRVRGLLTPIEVTASGTVLDGRARLRAARELGHEAVEVSVMAPHDELEHILRAALVRRHLDASQRAALALKLVPFEQLRADAQYRQRRNLCHAPEVATLPARERAAAQGRTREMVAAIAGTSARTAQDVITVHEHDPVLYERILRGERKANTAANEVRQALRDVTSGPLQNEFQDLRGFRPLPQQWTVDWALFFPVSGSVPQSSRLIDAKLTQALFDLPDGGGSLAFRNLKRGQVLGLPSGQDVAKKLKVTPLSSTELGAPEPTPLWFYILKESELPPVSGAHLGPVGGLIVGEVLLGLLELDPRSWWSVDPSWKPTIPIADRAGGLQMADLIAFATT
jgi:ParB-like chromosome segregation protein Spo0J